MPYKDPVKRREYHKEKSAEWARANPERIAEIQRAYRGRNLEEQRAASREYARQRRAAMPEHMHDINLRSSYGITHVAYAQMLASQGGVCAVCKAPRPGGRLRWFIVDHDHGTGAVRGLLCQPCNVTIGHSREDVRRLRECAEYIERHSRARAS